MEVLLKGRGVRLTDQVRRLATHKLAKLDRRPRPAILRVEVEIVGERNPSIGQPYHVQVACVTPRHTFRAEGSGPDIDSSLDQIIGRLDRQISTYRSKHAKRPAGRSVRIESGGTSPEGPDLPSQI